MKKIIVFILILVATISKAQEAEEKYAQDVNKKHEIKINALTLIAGEWLDGSYEYLINEESSFGTALAFGIGDVSGLNYSLTPFYRRYFSEKYARGFFVEGFGMLFSAETSGFLSDTETETGFAVGVSVGGKFVSKRGFSTEVFLGFGRNLSNNNDYFNEIVPRIGISLGYRF